MGKRRARNGSLIDLFSVMTREKKRVIERVTHRLHIIYTFPMKHADLQTPL